jgi:ribosomal-protein-alanine N-acetyltransferase
MRLDLHDGFYLGPVRDGDQAAYVEHFRDKDTTDRLLKIPYPYTQEHAEFWVRFRLDAAGKNPVETSFALRRPDGFLIGGAGIVLNGGSAAHRAEIGYWVARNYRGRGLATAAIKALSRYAFRNLGLLRLEATAFTHNPASHRVLEKAGFRREGILAGYHLKEGKLIDACMYALIKLPSQS